MPHRPSFSAIACVAIACLFALSAAAQNARQIMRAVDNSDRATLSGNVRPEANGANDRGRVPDGLPLTHMLLQLQRSPLQEQAAAAYVASLYDPASPNYHQWLTASEFGASFGVNPSDLAQIVSWLTSHGFTVNQVYPNGMLIDFSGTAGQIRAAFKTEIHDLSVNGAAHIGNMSRSADSGGTGASRRRHRVAARFHAAPRGPPAQFLQLHLQRHDGICRGAGRLGDDLQFFAGIQRRPSRAKARPSW